jgi:hypothetical protein
MATPGFWPKTPRTLKLSSSTSQTKRREDKHPALRSARFFDPMPKAREHQALLRLIGSLVDLAPASSPVRGH